MVVMDHYTRRVIGFGVHAGNVDGPTICRMFIQATSGQKYRYRLAPQPVFAPFYSPLTIVGSLDHCCQGGTSVLHSPRSLHV